MRTAAGMSQTELAGIVNKRQATISRWEADKDALLVNDMERLMQCFRARGLDANPPPPFGAPRRPVPVAGLIGDNGVVIRDPREERFVEAPAGVQEPVALEAYVVDTDSLYPMGRGWFLFAGKPTAKGVDESVNQFAVIETENRGSMIGWLRIIGKGRYMIERQNGPAVMLSDVARASRIEIISP